MLKAIVLGGSANVFKEHDEALKLFLNEEPDAYASCNDTATIWPGRLDYFCTLHPDKAAEWLAKRRANGHPMGCQVWSYKKRGGSRGVTPYPEIQKIASDWQGSSGLFCVRVLLQEGFERIICCGVPIEKQYSHIIRPSNPNWKPGDHWLEALDFTKGWKQRFPELKEKVRSMSGYTQRLLGAPTEHWLHTETPLVRY